MSINSTLYCARVTAGALVLAAISVVIQIVSGAEYPKVPPVFFILLMPAALLVFTQWRFVPLVAILGSVFLLIGLFTSGAYVRLTHPNSAGDTFGLWLMTISLIVAAWWGIITARKFSRKKSV